MSVLREVFTTVLNGVPRGFNKFMEYTVDTPINPGQLNKIGIRPGILNEHQESSSTVQDVVTATKLLIQYFRASKDNINGVFLNMESAAAETTIDDIEQANDAALQGDWVLGGTGTNLATLDAVVFSPNNSSTKSMKLMMDDFGDEWKYTKASGSWDLTGGTIEFDYHQTKESAKATMTLSINDGTNSSVITLAVPKATKDTWQHFSIPIVSFVGTADVSALTNIFFTITQSNGGEFAWVDNFRFRPEPGSVELELWDMGTSIPVSGVTKLDDGTQYATIGDLGIGGTVFSSIEVSLSGGRKLYHIHEFVCGAAKEESANAVLNINHWYALVVKYVDTNVSIYGSSGGSDYYSSGYSAQAASSAVAATAIGANQDFMFGILSTQDVYISEIEFKTFDVDGAAIAAGLNADLTIFLEDTNEQITDLVTTESAVGAEHKEDIGVRPALLEDGGKAEAYFNAGLNGGVVFSVLEIKYFYQLPTLHG